MSFLGGLIGGAFDLVGGALGQRSSESAGNKNAELQREFAKNGIRWRVADARAAGLHPLAALGSSGASASPAYQVGGGIGDAVSRMGQNIDRSIRATQTARERAEADAVALGTARAQQRNWELQNVILENQIAGRSAQVGPTMPSGVQSFPVTPDTVVTRDLVDIKPSEVISARSGDPGTQAGPAGPMMKAYRDPIFGMEWKLPETPFFDDNEILKSVVAVLANSKNFGRANNIPARLVYQWLNRPEWVDRNARREGHRTMIPYYDRNGVLFWRPVF